MKGIVADRKKKTHGCLTKRKVSVHRQAIAPLRENQVRGDTKQQESLSPLLLTTEGQISYAKEQSETQKNVVESTAAKIEELLLLPTRLDVYAAHPGCSLKGTAGSLENTVGSHSVHFFRYVATGDRCPFKRTSIHTQAGRLIFRLQNYKPTILRRRPLFRAWRTQKVTAKDRNRRHERDKKTTVRDATPEGERSSTTIEQEQEGVLHSVIFVSSTTGIRRQKHEAANKQTNKTENA